jgi:ADP-heptose:LPS heptosyltransferase
MWKMQASEKYGRLNGELFDHQFVNGICLVGKQYYWQFFKSIGFKDITPADWEHKKPEDMERILMIHYGGIGDVLFISSAIHAYKKAYPDVEIHLSTNFNSYQLMQNNPDISSFIIDKQQNVTNYADQYDDTLTYDTILAGNGDATTTNVYDLYLEWSGFNDIPDDEKKCYIYLTDQEVSFAKNFLEKVVSLEKDEKVIVIQIDSTTNIRNIEKDKFLELADKLAKENYKVLLFGGDISIKNSVSTKCKHCGTTAISYCSNEIVNFKKKCLKCGKIFQVNSIEKYKNKNVFFLENMNIRQISSIISLCDYFIGVDSCGTHIAGAFDKPVLGIYSSFDGDLRLRYNPKARWIQSEFRDAPCFLHHVPCRWASEKNEIIPPCMKQITTEQIFNEFNNLVKEHYGKAVINKEPEHNFDIRKSCPVCNSSSNTFITRKGNVHYVQCDACEAVYTLEIVTTFEKYSEDDYFIVYKKDGYIQGQKEVARIVNKKYAERFNYSGNLLEIGCARGDVLTELQRLGWEVQGSDSSNIFKSIYKQNKIPVNIGPFEEFNTLNKYSVIFLNNTFEHIIDPHSSLKKIKSLLKDNGVVSLIVPDSDTWDKCNNKWGHANSYFPGEHSILYNLHSISKLAELNGFEVKSCEKLPSSECIWVELEKKENDLVDNIFLDLYNNIKTKTCLNKEKCYNLYTLANRVKNLSGDIAEVGVYKGGSAKILAEIINGKPIHLFDTFTGIPSTNLNNNEKELKDRFNDVSLKEVKSYLKEYSNIIYHVGLFENTFSNLKKEEFCFIFVDADTYFSTLQACEEFYPRLIEGGIMIFDDYKYKECPGVSKAIAKFFKEKKEKINILPSFQCYIEKVK